VTNHERKFPQVMRKGGFPWRAVITELVLVVKSIANWKVSNGGGRAIRTPHASVFSHGFPRVAIEALRDQSPGRAGDPTGG